MDWSKADQLRLERLAASGISAALAATEFGVTRNAVLGRAHRTGVTFHGKRIAGPRKPPKPRQPRQPKEMGPRGGHWGRLKGGYIKPRALILQVLALHLAGVSQAKAAKAFGVSPQSIRLVWRRDPVLMAEARPIAERALAEARQAARQRHQGCIDRERRELEERDRRNERVFLILRPRHAQILRAYVETKNMAAAGERFGITRERVRQIVMGAERKGFVGPTNKGVHRGFQKRAA